MARTVRFGPSFQLAALGVLVPLAGCNPDDVSLVDEGLEVTPSPSACAEWAEWLKNVEEGLEVVDRADSSALAIQDLLLRIRARALRAASEVTSEDDRALQQSEYAALATAIELLAHSTTHDGTGLLDGSVASWEVTVSDDTSWGVVTIELSDLTTSTLGVDTAAVDISSASDAQAALDTEDWAREQVEILRSSLAADHDALVAFGELYEDLYAGCESSCDCCDDEGGSASIGQDPDEAQAAVLDALVSNIEEAIELVEMAAGAAEGIDGVLDSMRALAVESSSEELADDERAYIQDSFEALSAEVDRSAAAARYNDMALLDGVNAILDVQVGDANTSNERISVELSDLTASALGVDTSAVDLSSATGAQSAIDVFDTALDTVASVDSGLDASAVVLGVLLENVQRQMD